MKDDKTLLVIMPGKNSGEGGYYLLVAETGEVLASHFCSSSGYAYGDLYSTRPERIEKWTERFGDFEVKFIDDTNINQDALMERNIKFYKNEK